MTHLNLILVVLVPFCIVKTTLRRGSGPAQSAEICLFVDALRCILDSISEENDPFKSHCFSTIFTCEFNTEEWVGPDQGPKEKWFMDALRFILNST